MTANPRSALWVPLFGELADPLVVARVAAEAEEAGWAGFFVWDRLTWPAPVERVADPWISLAAAAMATDSLRLGPMVTPVARRRPAKLARETASYVAASATWCLTDLDPEAITLDHVRGVLADGPAAPARGQATS